MPFIGTLQGEQLFTVDVTPAVQTGIAPAAVTVIYVNGTGNKVRDIDILTLSVGDPFAGYSRVIPRNTTRLYIEIDLAGTGVQVRVIQGILVHTSDLLFDGRLVFDVV